MSESVTGYIDHVIFRNEENGYTVMILKGVEDEEELTLRTGTLPCVCGMFTDFMTWNFSVQRFGSFFCFMLSLDIRVIIRRKAVSFPEVWYGRSARRFSLA